MSCKKNALPGMLESNRATAEGERPIPGFLSKRNGEIILSECALLFCFPFVQYLFL